MRTFLIAAILVAVAGCATSNEQAYYDALAKIHSRPTMPLVELVAQPGQQITGLQSLKVYAPENGQSGAVVPQYREQHHPAWGIAATAVQVGLPIYLGGQAAIGLSKAVGDRVGAVARDVTVVDPVIVTQPDPTIVQTPDPIIVQPQPPTIIEQPAPIIVPSPDPIIIEQPAPIVIPGGGP